jgi:hypothetical protein
MQLSVGQHYKDTDILTAMEHTEIKMCTSVILLAIILDGCEILSVWKKRLTVSQILGYRVGKMG